MGRFNALKTTIDANIRENGNQEITGEILNRVLNEMVSVTEEEVADAAASGGGGGADLTEVNKKIAELTEETERLEAGKQDALVSGINIKTINGQNILGRGNIEIEGGGGGGTASEGAKMYPIYIPSLLMVEELSDTQKEANAAVYQSVINKEDAVYYLHQAIEGYDMDLRIVCTGISAAFGMVILQAYVYGVSTVTQFAITINEDGTITDDSPGDIPLGGGGTSVQVIDNLESTDATAALSANQGRVIKEMIDDLPSGGVAEGAKLYPIYSPKLMVTNSITEEQQAANKAAFEAAARGDNMWCYAANYNGDDAKLNAQMVVRADEGLLVTFIYTYIIPEQSVIQMMNQTYINSDGSIAIEIQGDTASPSIEIVENLIAQSVTTTLNTEV
jgi:hypothetical protein